MKEGGVVSGENKGRRALVITKCASKCRALRILLSLCIIYTLLDLPGIKHVWQAIRGHTQITAGLPLSLESPQTENPLHTATMQHQCTSEAKPPPRERPLPRPSTSPPCRTCSTPARRTGRVLLHGAVVVVAVTVRRRRHGLRDAHAIHHAGRKTTDPLRGRC